MGPNDAELARVWTRAVGGAISDTTCETGSDFEVVVDAEVGDALHGGGGPYEANVVVRDLSDSASINEQTVSGNFGDANWPAPPPDSNLAKQFPFTVPAAAIAGREGNILEVLAYLTVGGVGPQPPDVSFATSPRFIVTGP